MAPLRPQEENGLQRREALRESKSKVENFWSKDFSADIDGNRTSVSMLVDLETSDFEIENIRPGYPVIPILLFSMMDSSEFAERPI